MKGFVDKSMCIGCGLCASISPDVFDMDTDGLAKAIDAKLTGDLIEAARDAEAQCPVSAIKVE